MRITCGFILLLPILLAIITLPSFSQTSVTLEGNVIDKDNKIPISFATVSIIGKSIGTVTDGNGWFTMTLFEVSYDDTIKVSYMGYNSYKQSVLAFIEGRGNKIELEEKYYTIAEVTIRPSKFNLNRFMEKVIEKYNNSRRADPHIALSHYRETAIYENRYLMFNESIGYSIYMGEMHFLDGNWDDSQYLMNYRFFYDNTRLSTHDSDWKRLYGRNPSANVPLHGSAPLQSFRWFEVHGPLNTQDKQFSLFPQYRYLLDTTFHINQQIVYRIRFSPTVFNRKNRVIGYMEVYEEDYRIQKVEWSGPGIRTRILPGNIEGVMIFEMQYYDEQPYLSVAWQNYEINGYSHSTEINILLQKFDEFEVTRDEYFSLGTYDWFPYISYNNDKWARYNIPYPAEIQAISNDLKLINGKELEDQFLNNSDRWYVKPPDRPDGLGMDQVTRAITFVNNLQHLF